MNLNHFFFLVTSRASRMINGRTLSAGQSTWFIRENLTVLITQRKRKMNLIKPPKRLVFRFLLHMGVNSSFFLSKCIEKN